MKYDINELYPSARHAYNAIGLAVKTSRPQYVNELNLTVDFKVGRYPFLQKGSGYRPYTIRASIPNAGSKANKNLRTYAEPTTFRSKFIPKEHT